MVVGEALSNLSYQQMGIGKYDGGFRILFSRVCVCGGGGGAEIIGGGGGKANSLDLLLKYIGSCGLLSVSLLRLTCNHLISFFRDEYLN